MKNKGFTLVEILAVIIILSLLGVIGIISIESITKKGAEKAYQAQISEIKSAAENLIKIEGEPTWCREENICFISLRYLALENYIKLKDKTYIVKSGDTIFTISSKFNISEEELENSNDLSDFKEGMSLRIPASKFFGDFINPRTDESFSLENVVLIKKYNKNYIFEVFEDLNEFKEKYSEYLEKAKKDAVRASALAYKKKGLCNDSEICNLRISDLVRENLLETNYYNEAVITISSSNEVSIG